MYRYIVDDAVIYTSEDFVLFREAPFACWMERLTLENPDHGIPPDVGSLPPGDSIERQDDMGETLRVEGKDVCLIDWGQDEPDRRSATLEAMHKGTDFIVNGQLALGPLSGAVNLLVRTSGYSELGDFLYIPCETQAGTTLYSAFRLCFLADLLHSLQGQLPPQMPIIRGGDDLVPLQTENHIYHYRAVKQRFMKTMRSFRKHRMPDPAESPHFGRWSDCAHEVLKQRLLREEHQGDDTTGDEYVEPLRKAMGTAVGGGEGSYGLDDIRQPVKDRDEFAAAALLSAGPDASGSLRSSAAASPTLVEQARMLKPGTYKPGPGVFRLRPPRTSVPSRPAVVVDDRGQELANELANNLAKKMANQEFSGPVTAVQNNPVSDHSTQAIPLDTISDAPVLPQESTVTDKPLYNRRASDAALQNLEFIGGNTPMPGIGPDVAPATEGPPVANSAPAASLRDPRTHTAGRENFAPVTASDPALGKSAVWPSSAEDQKDAMRALTGSPVPPAEARRAAPLVSSAIDMDGTHLASPPPGLTTSHNADLPADLPFEAKEVEHGFGQSAADKHQPAGPGPFSDSIFNSRIFTEGAPDEGKFSNSLMTSDDCDT